MDVDLRRRGAINPLLVIAVVDVIRDILHKLIYVDKLAVVAGSGADLQERLVEWKELFGRHGLKV